MGLNANAAKKHESKLTKCIKAPIRMLTKARDLYVKSLTDCSGKMTYGSVASYPTGYATSLPKSYSTNSARSSTDEDLRELIRAASQRGLREKLDREVQQQKLPRSFTVGIQRIDEDQTCDFDDHDIKVKKIDVLYPRSKSYAVSKRTGLYSS